MGERPIGFLTRLVPEPGPQLLQKHFELRGNLDDRPLARSELLAGVAGAHALFCLLNDVVDAEVLDAAGPGLRVVANMAVGYDNIDVAAATERGVVVTNTPGVLTETTADLAWALLLAAARRVVEGDRLVREGRFTGWSPNLLLGWEIHGKTLGIIGMGRIGRATARRAAGFGMRVLYTGRGGPLPDSEVPADASWEYREKLEDLLREVDFLSLHVPLSDETHHLIGASELKLLGESGILVNTARGSVVDEDALVEALRAKTIAAAGLDVYENEPEIHPGLLGLDNVVLLPHLGSAGKETRGRMARLMAENAIAVMEGRRPAHVVNPQVLGADA